MESKDLRIGNKIYGSLYYDTEEAKHDLGFGYSEQKEWTVETVESVCSEHDDYLCDLENDTEMERLKPIPLTSDFLIRFGFDTVGNGIGLHRIVIGVKAIFYVLIMDDKKHCSLSNSFTETRIPKDINYVHELQNLHFALTGSELVFSEA